MYRAAISLWMLHVDHRSIDRENHTFFAVRVRLQYGLKVVS